MHGILLEMHSLGYKCSLISSSAGTGSSRNKFEILANLDEDCSSTLVSFPHVDHFLGEWMNGLCTN